MSGVDAEGLVPDDATIRAHIAVLQRALLLRHRGAVPTRHDDQAAVLAAALRRATGRPWDTHAVLTVLAADAPVCSRCFWPVAGLADRLSGWCAVCRRWTGALDGRLTLACSVCRRVRATSSDLVAGWCRTCCAVTNPGVDPAAPVLAAFGLHPAAEPEEIPAWPT